jgi:methylamine dehydrogenase accessory protein MauD
LLNTTEGLDLDKPAPLFEAYDVKFNRTIKLDDLKGHTSILIFISPSCSPCKELLLHLKEFQRSWKGKIYFVMISQGERDASLNFIAAQDIVMTLLLDTDGKLSKMFQVRATPFAYQLDKNGVVRKRGIVNNRAGLEELLEPSLAYEATVGLPTETG